MVSETKSFGPDSDFSSEEGDVDKYKEMADEVCPNHETEPKQEGMGNREDSTKEPKRENKRKK